MDIHLKILMAKKIFDYIFPNFIFCYFHFVHRIREIELLLESISCLGK